MQRRKAFRRTALCVPFALVMMAAACASPSQRIATSLTRYGLDDGQAQCVGGRLESNLSLSQLQQLGRAARAFNSNDATPGQLTVEDLLRVSSQIEDARVPLEVAKAAGSCGLVAGLLR